MDSRMEHQKNIGFPLHDWNNHKGICKFSLVRLEDMSQEFKEECLKEYEEGYVLQFDVRMITLCSFYCISG